MTRLLCMRLGTGLSGATLVTCILRDGSPRAQADMWSRMPPFREKIEVERLIAAAIEKHARGDVEALARGIIVELDRAGFEIVRRSEAGACPKPMSE